jgi:predicted metal-dependent hydrolase
MTEPEAIARACAEPPPELLREGVALFNQGRYFEQHEVLEELWRRERREVRRLYQGILQIGVAFHHLRRRNYHGVVYMLTRGAMYLRPFAPRCQGVDVEALLADAARALDAVRALGPGGLDRFDWRLAPRVRLHAPDAAPADDDGL